MALKEVFHVVATHFPIEADHFNSSDSRDIIEGMAVNLDTNGNAKAATATSRVIGIAGDSLDQTGGNTELAADIVINAAGDTRSSSNRVSDFFNEALASGRMTVYMTGGEFLTDRYVTSMSWDGVDPGAQLYSDANGNLTTTDGGGYRVGLMLARPAALESGVPGTDVRGSITSGNFLRFTIDLAIT